ncbi:MAG: sulfur carrier protein ThiS [Marinicaulis sp.]|nr:sulfur carrier protein ThiS [Marinicaulis sp.]
MNTAFAAINFPKIPVGRCLRPPISLNRRTYTYTRFLPPLAISEEVEFPVNITFNGEQMNVDAPISVAGLLSALELEPRKIAVERNLEIVPKSLYGDTVLVDGDRIEIVQFVGGG